LRASSLVASLTIVSACAVGPDYERPRVDLPDRMPDAAPVTTGGTASAIVLTSADPADRWWTLFGDPQLERLVHDARFGNQDIRAAVARVHAARAAVIGARAPLFPSVGAFGVYSYNRLGTNVVQSTPSASTPSIFNGQPFQFWAGGGEMSYEIDLWGRIRRGLEAADAQAEASDEDRKNVEITVTAEVAEAYFDLGAAVAERAIFEEGVRVREGTVAYVRERFAGGIAPELDLKRALSELARARSLVPEAERRQALAEHRLAVLLGYMPTLHFKGRPPAEFDLPPQLPVGLPASLLGRRPDIRAAEHRLKSTNANIGQAIAGFFPEFSIFGRAGYASIDAWKLAQPGSQFWFVGPQVHLPIFEGGRTYAQVLETEARTDAATAEYVKVIQVAFREIADAIAGIAAQERVRDEQKENVAQSEIATALVTEQYEKGTTNYLNVLDAQRTLLEARSSLVDAQRALLSNIVQLEKALGGGWTPETPGDEAPKEK
jgi:NodT family efflux transporter outer membrane factor (OMF) lipoprotein